MTAPTLNKTPKDNLLASVWRTLTQPASTLRDDVKPKARILAAVMLLFFPLGVFALAISPLTSLVNNQPFVMPSPIYVIGLFSILGAYLLSRSSYYRVGAWFAIAIPPVAIVLPILLSEAEATAASLFFIAMSVILSGLLLSSKETIIIGGALGVLVLMLPEAGSISATSSSSVNVSVFSFILMITGLTAIVGREREQYVNLLSQSQSELKQSLNKTEIALERAERSDQIKSAFLASMSHELRTPLNAVINFTKFVAKGDLGPVNEDQVETLNEVVDSAKHLLNLINDVLDMSKIDSGSLNLFIQNDVSIEDILDTATSMGRSLLVDKSVELYLDIPGDLPTIRADKQRILQIILNIMSNACKFTEEGSIEVRATQKSDEIVISVMDTGPGIAPEDQSLVFEAFKQTAVYRQVAAQVWVCLYRNILLKHMEVVSG